MSLNVYYRNSLVGSLKYHDQEGRIHFEYSDDWIRSSDSFPISRSLPLSGTYELGSVDHRFFANLLPEAAAREAICRGLGISIDNDFELLAAIGGECAGALRIVPEEGEKEDIYDYEPISDTDLKKAIDTRISYTRLSAGGKLRLSLAGAQDKWPVYFDGKRLYWPLGAAPSSHILKFASHDFKGLNWNEAYTSFIAGRLGLPVVEVSIGRGYSLTKRFDRREDENGTIFRLHQEDFCQAMGYPNFKKYENEGGPAFRECIELVRAISVSSGKDQIKLLRWQILNLLIGNADGHAKNLSILYAEDGPKLSDFYDIVCTSVYPGISKHMAFSVGGTTDPGQIRGKDWKKFADELGMRPRIILNTLHTFIDMLQHNLNEYHQEFVDRNGTDPVLDRIDQTIRKQIRRTRTLLKG